MNASYIYSLIIEALVLPIALNTEISFAYSNMLAVIEDDREKKHKVITTAVRAVKIVVIKSSFDYNVLT